MFSVGNILKMSLVVGLLGGVGFGVMAGLAMLAATLDGAA